MKINIIYIIDYCFKLRAVSDCIINFFFSGQIRLSAYMNFGLLTVHGKHVILNFLFYSPIIKF